MRIMPNCCDFKPFSQKQPEEWSQNWLPIIVATENICEEQLSYCAVLSMALDFKAVHFEK